MMADTSTTTTTDLINQNKLFVCQRDLAKLEELRDDITKSINRFSNATGTSGFGSVLRGAAKGAGSSDNNVVTNTYYEKFDKTMEDLNSIYNDLISIRTKIDADIEILRAKIGTLNFL